MGYIDNAVLMLASYVLFLQIDRHFERLFKKKMDAVLCGAISAGLGNTISDWMGFAFQGEFALAFYCALGCLVGMSTIFICEMYKKFN